MNQSWACQWQDAKLFQDISSMESIVCVGWAFSMQVYDLIINIDNWTILNAEIEYWKSLTDWKWSEDFAGSW